MAQHIQMKNKIVTVLAVGKYAISRSEIWRHVWKKIRIRVKEIKQKRVQTKLKKILLGVKFSSCCYYSTLQFFFLLYFLDYGVHHHSVLSCNKSLKCYLPDLFSVSQITCIVPLRSPTETNTHGYWETS